MDAYLWILLSMRISLNLESLSFLLRSKCFLTATAFLINMYRSSGIAGARPNWSEGRELLLLWDNTINRNVCWRTRLLEDSQNLVTSHTLHLGNAVGVAEDNADLTWREAMHKDVRHPLQHQNQITICIPGKESNLSWRACWPGPQPAQGWSWAKKEELSCKVKRTWKFPCRRSACVPSGGQSLIEDIYKYRFPFPKTIWQRYLPFKYSVLKYAVT